ERPMATMSRRRAFPPCRAAPPPGEPPPPAPGSGTFEAHENGPVPGAALLEHPRRHLPGSILPAIRLEPEIFDRLSVREHLREHLGQGGNVPAALRDLHQRMVQRLLAGQMELVVEGPVAPHHPQ